ncbi:hypothetical protein [Ketobacter sp.]
MGAFNTFRALNQDGIATKLYKFQMSQMFTAARQGGFTTSKHVEILKEGSCVGYTLLWIRQQLKNDNTFAFSRDGTYTGVIPATTGGGVGMLGIRLQTLYQQLCGAGTPEAIAGALESMGKCLGIQLNIDCDEEHDGLDDALEAIREKPTGTVYYLDINMLLNRTTETSHGIGVCHGLDGQLYVFDPNCGEYAVDGPTMFAIYLEEAYGKYYTHAKFQKCFVCPVLTS